MKILQFTLVTMMVAVFSFSVSAQSIKDLIDAGTYYEDENYFWYEFVAPDDIDAETSEYVLWEEVSSTLYNGWRLGWPADDYGCVLEWDPYGTGSFGAGLITSEPKEISDNGYASPGLKLGTPQLAWNTADYPVVAIKFGYIPACGTGGWQDGKDHDVDPNSYFMYGGVRYSIVERAATSSTGTNSDFYMWIPRNNDDTTHMLTTMGWNYTDWLTIYNPNSGDIVYDDPSNVYIFDIRNAIARNNNNAPAISSSAAACIDMYIGVQDVVSETDYLTVEWIRCFYDADEAMEYADDLYGEGSNSIESVQDATIHVVSTDGTISISGIENPSVEVYNLQGQKVAAGITNEISLSAGFYIVNVTSGTSTRTFKVVNK